MNEHAANQIMELLQAKRFHEALARLQVELHEEPNDWYGCYMLGMAYRGTKEFDSAIIAYLASLKFMPEGATKIRATVLLNLGIAFQHEGNYDDAVRALTKALSLSPGMITALNSLGYTYRLMERHEEALGFYDQSMSCLFVELYRTLDSSSQPSAADPHGSSASLWMKKACEVAESFAHSEGMRRCAIATETTPIPSLHRKSNGFFFDVPSDDGGIRQLLPNYFNTIYALLRRHIMYAMLANNIGGALIQLDRRKQAIEMLHESIEFIPDGVEYRPPYIGLEQLGVKPKH